MASPVDTSVKFFNEAMPGAPVLNGVAGSLIGVLDACLATGFGLRSATSLVVSGGVATLNLPSDVKNAALLHSVILVEGVTGALTALNGEQKVTFASEVHLRFATAAADGTAAGAITVKTAPAGWAKVFSGTNKAAYKSLDVQSLGMHLWVNDTSAAYANVRGFEAMASVDVGTGAFPTLAELATGGFWWKSASANGNAVRWGIFSDGRAFHFMPQTGSSANAAHIHCPSHFFGDFLANRSVDAYASCITSSFSVPGNSTQGSISSYASGANNARAPRSLSGLGSAVAMYPWSPGMVSINTYSGQDVTQGTYPPPDGRLRLVQPLLNEGSPNSAATVLRGAVPGVLHVPQTELYKSFSPGDTVTVTSGAIAGRVLYAVYSGGGNTDTLASIAGRAFVDITGPWR